MDTLDAGLAEHLRQVGKAAHPRPDPGRPRLRLDDSLD
jgi:hypothetical protein